MKNLIVNMGTVELQAITCFDSAQQDKLDMLRRWRHEGLEGFSRGCPKLVEEGFKPSRVTYLCAAGDGGQEMDFAVLANLFQHSQRRDLAVHGDGNVPFDAVVFN